MASNRYSLPLCRWIMDSVQANINAKVEVKPRSKKSMLFLTGTVHLSFYGALIPP